MSTDRIVKTPEWDILVQAESLLEVRDYNHRMMNIPLVHKTTKGKAVKIGVLDTGVPRHDCNTVRKIPRRANLSNGMGVTACGGAERSTAWPSLIRFGRGLGMRLR